MTLFFVRRKDSGMWVEWDRIVNHWVAERERATFYRDRTLAENVAEELTVWCDTPCEIEEIDVSAGQEALEILAAFYSIRNLGDTIYQVRDSEGLGWDGPQTTAWGKACQRAEQLLKTLAKETKA
jgi:hypothetical protein